MSDSQGKLFRILSIDGGGIRGILPAQILVALEKKLQARTNNSQARIADYFDLIAGTSTGGILTCAYLMPDKNNPARPRYSAKEAVDFYLENGGNIFSTATYQFMLSMGGITDERYSEKPIESALMKYFGDTQLSELIRPCLVTSYDVYESKAHFFRQHAAKDTEGRNYLVRDVARATSAAPTYFEAAKITSTSQITYPLIDGGVFANNPTLCAYAEAHSIKTDGVKTHRTADDLFIFSLGTGSASKRKLEHKNVKDWGAIEWIKPLIDIMMSGVSQTVHYQLRQIYSAIGKAEQYVRIEPDIYNASAEMDEASPKNLNALREAGMRNAEAEENNLKLDNIVTILLQNA
ncbi:MAG: patatin [Bacteroidetes bacterium]|nr:MAG: patatin [Bacteroidota bacterium]